MNQAKKLTEGTPNPVEAVNLEQENVVEESSVFEDEMDIEPPVTPTWFSRTYQQNDPDELARRYRERLEQEPHMPLPPPEAYEHYKRRIEERFQAGKRLAEQQYSNANNDVPGRVPMPVRRPVVRNVADDGMRRFQIWDEQVAQAKGRRAPKPPRSGIGSLATGVAIACIAGGVIGYFTATGSSPVTAWNLVKEKTTAIIAAYTTPTPLVTGDKAKVERNLIVAQADASETVLTKKPIKIPRLTVADASGTLNDPIPLDLAAFPVEPSEPLALKVTGLPDNAYLTQGKEIAKGQWLVKSDEIAGVKLVIPTSTENQVDLMVAAVEEKTLMPAAPAQELSVALDMKDLTVVPAAAPPEGMQLQGAALPEAIPLPLEVTNNEGQSFLNKGNTLLKTGDFNSARQFFIKAHEKGVAEAAYGVGQTYDPVVYIAMKVTGLAPDKAKAQEWYEKAAKSGFAPATLALQNLNLVSGQ